MYGALGLGSLLKAWWHYVCLNNSDHVFWELWLLFFGMVAIVLFLDLPVLALAALARCRLLVVFFLLLLLPLALSLLAYLFHLAPLCEFAVAVCRSFWSWLLLCQGLGALAVSGLVVLIPPPPRSR